MATGHEKRKRGSWTRLFFVNVKEVLTDQELHLDIVIVLFQYDDSYIGLHRLLHEIKLWPQQQDIKVICPGFCVSGPVWSFYCVGCCQPSLFSEEKGALRQSSVLVTKIRVKCMYDVRWLKLPQWIDLRFFHQKSLRTNEVGKRLDQINCSWPWLINYRNVSYIQVVQHCQHCRDFNRKQTQKTYVFWWIWGGYLSVEELLAVMQRSGFFPQEKEVGQLGRSPWLERGWSWKRPRSPCYYSYLSFFLVFGSKFGWQFGTATLISRSPIIFCFKHHQIRGGFGRWLRRWWRWFLEQRIIKIWRASFWQKISYTFWGGWNWRLGLEKFPLKNMEMSKNPKLKGKNHCDLNLEFVIWVLNFMEGTCKVAFRLRKGAWNLTNEHAPMCFLGTHLTFRFQSHFWVQRWSPRLLLDRVSVSLSYFRVVGPLLQVILRGWEEMKGPDTWEYGMLFWCTASLPKTNIALENRPGAKSKGLSPKHHFCRGD